MVLVGLNDLLADWGLPGQYDHPRVREVYAHVIAACRKHGKHCGVGGLATRPDLVAEFVRMGARYVSTGTDLGVPARAPHRAGKAGAGDQALMAAPQAISERPRLCQPPRRPTPSRARCCIAHGAAADEDAATIAGCLVSADLRGVDTHGLCRLPIYLDRVRARPDQSAARRWRRERVTPVAASLDGQNGFGFVIGMRAMREAIAMAREFGIGVVSVAAQHAFRHGRVLCAAGGRSRLDGDGVLQRLAGDAAVGRRARRCSAPIRSAWRRPAGKHPPFLLDMSPAVAARGKIRRAERRGEKIPLGYALDGDGRPTTDPKAALGGVVLPIGELQGLRPLRCSWTSSAA